MAKNHFSFEYYHGCESEQFAFYRIPKVLFTDPYFKDLSSDAKILYGLMLDRMSLSVKNGWIDENDRVYIIFTLEQVMEQLGCGKDKGVKILAELDTGKGIGLIERVKRGLGKPAIIYVKNFIIKKKEDIDGLKYESTKKEQQVEVTEVKSSEKPKSGILENRSLEFGKTEVKDPEKSESETLENRSAEFGNTDAIKTNINNTDYNQNQSIYSSQNMWHVDGMRMIDAYSEIIKTNIDYDILIHDSEAGEKQYIDEIVELMVEIVCVERENVLIAGAEIPYSLVKSRFLKIRLQHVQYVLHCLRNNTTQVRNVKSYLLTCLYNAPATMGNYYRSAVNHDMYGGT